MRLLLNELGCDHFVPVTIKNRHCPSDERPRIGLLAREAFP